MTALGVFQGHSMLSTALIKVVTALVQQRSRQEQYEQKLCLNQKTD